MSCRSALVPTQIARGDRRPATKVVHTSHQPVYVSKDDAPTGVTMCRSPSDPTSPLNASNENYDAAIKGGLHRIRGFPRNKWSERHHHHRVQRGLRHSGTSPLMVVSSPASPVGPLSPPHHGLPHPTAKRFAARKPP
jgi:hypothetical protein